MDFSALSSALHSTVRRSDFLIIIPPWADWRRAALGPHLLQAIARKRGFDVQVLYANVALAGLIGPPIYDSFLDLSKDLLGERVFARAAHDLPALGRNGSRFHTRKVGTTASGLTAGDLESVAAQFVGIVADVVARFPTPIVGCSASFEQTNASLAILRRIKHLVPQTTTVLGGPNCDGPMGAALYDVAQGYVDTIFSGEADEVIADFLRAGTTATPARGVITGAPMRDLDSLPTPEFFDYLAQVRSFLPQVEPRKLSLPYETSRGCWWGAKQHCTFCGLNGEGMAYRQKAPRVVLDDLERICASTGITSIQMTDNILPHAYLRSLIPALAEQRIPGLQLFYEIKSNLSFADTLALRQAGIIRIQPGIEALSTPLLQLMRKGVTAAQNVALLRYALSCGIETAWNLLVRFPNDDLSWYEHTADLIPLLHHLQPPGALYDVSIERFSPYFDHPEQFGITGMRPLQAYADIFPPAFSPERSAFHFQASINSPLEHDHELRHRLEAAVRRWQDLWQDSARRVSCHVFAISDERFSLTDTRAIASRSVTIFTKEIAREVLTRTPMLKVTAAQQLALEARLAAVIDDYYVPLPTVDLDAALALELIPPCGTAILTESHPALFAAREVAAG